MHLCCVWIKSFNTTHDFKIFCLQNTQIISKAWLNLLLLLFRRYPKKHNIFVGPRAAFELLVLKMKWPSSFTCAYLILVLFLFLYLRSSKIFHSVHLFLYWNQFSLQILKGKYMTLNFINKITRTVRYFIPFSVKIKPMIEFLWRQFL